MASAADYTDEQVEQIRAIFNVCDTTGDGFITKDELAGSLVKLGSAPLSDDALDSLMTQLDTDGNGKIDFDEFLHGMEAIIGSQGGAGGGDDDGGDDDGGDYGGDDDDEGVEFTEKQLQELRNIFELTDSDNSGSIDKAELGSLLRRVGHDVDDDVIDQVFGLMEVNSVGEVEFEQVVIHLGTTLLGLSEKHEEAAAEAAETGAVALTPEQEEQLIEIFNSCDVDESGELDLAELQDILQALGHHASPAELEALMAQLDEDGNGKMNLHEFLTGLGPIFVRELESQQQSAGAVKLHAEVAVQILKDMGRVDEMNSAWAEFAGDHNEVDTIDLRALMHAVGMQPTRQEIRALTKAMDPESTGYISYEHFAVEVAKKIEQSGLDRSRDANDGTEGTEGDDLGAPETLEEAMLQLSKLKDKVVALHDDVDRYKSQAEDARKAGVESNQRNTELTEQLFSLKRDLKDLRKENKQIGELQKDKRELYQEVESYQAEIQEARKREAALRKEEQELRAYKAEAVGRMSNLLNEVSRMTEESNTLREEATAATREAREIAREQKKSEAERNKDVDELRTATEALAAVQGQLASYQERYAELDERYKKLQADSEKEKIELENQLSMAGGGGKHRPNAAGSLASEMYDMGEDVVDPNKERIRDLTAELMQVESERDELREQLSAMAALQERVAAAEKALADAEAQHARDMAAAEEQFNAKRGTFDQLGEEMAAQIEGLNAEIAAAVAAKEAAEAALADEHNKLELEQAERTKALADLEAARKETADAQARMAALQEKLNDIEEARLAAQAGAANAKDTFQHEREALEKQIADLEATVAARDESLAGKDAEIEALNKRIAELEAEIERLNGELTVARSEAGSSAQALQEQLEARGKEIADLKAQMLQIAAESATNQEAANKRAADLETELAGVRDELSGANAALDKARSDLETAQAAAGEEGEAVARLSKKLEETKAALAELSDLKEQLVAKVLREKEKRHDAAEAFEARIKDAEDQLAAANATVAERDATVAEREAAIAEKDAALAEAATASAAKDTTIAERDATIEDLKARLAAAAEGNAALSDANAALDSTRADLEAANKGLAEKEAALAAAQAEVQAKVVELATAAETLAGVETSLAEKEAEVAAREATIGERDAEVVELKAEIERLKVAVTEAEAAAELQEKIVILEQKIVTVESEKEVVVVEKTDVETELASTKDQLADALSRLGELEARPEPEPQRVILSDVQDLPLEESEAALIDYVNQLLGTDIELSSYIPISKRTLSVATACQDGVVLCKLVNKVCPGTLDERVIVRDIRDEEDVLENHSLCLNSARALGANIMNMQPEDFATGRVPIVLSFMFELVKVGLLSKVSLTEHPEFIELKQSGEDMETVSRLPAEQYLVRWMNFHLEAAGSDRRVNNFSDDLADGVVYTTLFHQLAPDECDLTPLEETDPTERAKLIVEFSDRIGCKVFVNPMDIVEGNAKMNLFFLANMADKWPGITVTEQQQEEVKQIQIHDVEGTREERVYLLWIQSLGIEADVKNLLTDLSDGIALLQIFDAVKPGVVKWRRVETKKLNDFKRVENCNMACNIATEELDIILVSIDGRDIFEGNKKATYAILWQAMRYHILSIISSLSLDGKRLEEEDVCAWANDKVASVGKDTHMSSFKDKSLADGLFFIDLLFAIRSRAVNYALVTPGETEEDKELNAKYAISVARKMGALVFLLWEDIVEVKQKLLLTFVGTLMSLQQ